MLGKVATKSLVDIEILPKYLFYSGGGNEKIVISPPKISSVLYTGRKKSFFKTQNFNDCAGYQREYFDYNMTKGKL